jgi:hypothetical protein
MWRSESFVEGYRDSKSRLAGIGNGKMVNIGLKRLVCEAK